MQLTPEQQQILTSNGNIIINAVAGSGKTTTLIQYAKTRPANSRILYLAFNKSVRLEAIKKFEENNLTNVKVETAHSLAYRHVVFAHHYKVKKQGYKTNEIADILSLQGNGEKHTEYVIANHINKFVAFFCNSDKRKVQELNYFETINDDKAEAFVKSFYPYIEQGTRLFLSKMDRGEIDITHDFYLKKFQLSQPQLYYDYILFDEGQDASAAMLDIFLQQRATKVIVGDTHQQIYGWRYAVNSLQKVPFTTYQLTTSFRFGDEIAKLAIEVLELKKHLSEDPKTVAIAGTGKNESVKQKAVLARTNLGLLLKAIEYVTEKKTKNIYFEGNISSYTYADDGASLYDVLNLSAGKKHLIRDKMIGAMNDLEELKDYIDKTEDVQLSMMIGIVEEYGDEIPGIIKNIKERHIEGDDKSKAELIFSTVHRCKGMEYDTVQLVNDFITEEKIKKAKENKEKVFDVNKLNEEINLLYVAVTRTRNKVFLPETLLPANTISSSKVLILKTLSEEDKKHIRQKNQTISYDVKKRNDKEPAYSYLEKRKQYKESCQTWNDELDEELTHMYLKGESLSELAEHFSRTKGAILSRVRKLKLEEQ